MRKSFLLILIVALMVSSCSSYTATGAYVGGEFGHVIGSAIGSITGGRRGYDMGSLIGTVGGAVAGAAIGSAVENAQKQKYEKYDQMAQQEQRSYGDRPHESRSYPQRAGKKGYHFDRVDSGDDVVADDRIDFDEGDMSDVPSFSVDELSRRPAIEIRNASIIDGDHNGVLTRGEECTVMFEIMNNTSSTVYDIYPLVEDATVNNHVKVSPTLRVESIAPYQGVRYTATILADKKLKDGEIVIKVAVAQGQRVIDTQTREFTIPTRKKAVQ